jgi:hypothetical protein
MVAIGRLPYSDSSENGEIGDVRFVQCITVKWSSTGRCRHGKRQNHSRTSLTRYGTRWCRVSQSFVLVVVRDAMRHQEQFNAQMQRVSNHLQGESLKHLPNLLDMHAVGALQVTHEGAKICITVSSVSVSGC